MYLKEIQTYGFKSFADKLDIKLLLFGRTSKEILFNFNE